MIASQKDRIPLMVSGDLHAIASGIISGSGDLNLDRSVNSILAGPISSDDLAWPSNFRGVGAMVPTAIKIDERTKPLENNGFTLLDIDPEGISVRQFAWHKSRGIGEIDSLDPISTFRL